MRRKKLEEERGQEYGGTHSKPHHFLLFLEIIVAHGKRRFRSDKTNATATYKGNRI